MTYNPKAQFIIHNGKMEEVLPTLTGKFHAVLCDPPYGIAFMSKAFDTFQGSVDFQSAVKSWGTALLPLLYPGAIVMMFGGTRTWHRLAAGMEDAGFEIWDTLLWLYGSGFPKAQDISKLIDKANGYEREVAGLVKGTASNNTEARGTYASTYASEKSVSWSGHKTCALKPAWEPVLCFRAPSQGRTYAELAQTFGSGALNIDGGRIGTDLVGWGVAAAGGNTWNEENCGLSKDGDARPSVGRYPANLALDEESAEMLDEQSGVSEAKEGNRGLQHSGRHGGICDGGNLKQGTDSVRGHSDSGGASRFFYCAKAASAERHGGVENNNHPTVKPIDLCTWLATLLLPPSSVANRRLLVPFSGSGSEMIGALGAGWDEVVGVEMDAGYCDIARARIKHHVGLLSADGAAAKPVQKVNDRQPEFFF